MNIINDRPRATLATTGGVLTATYHAKIPLLVGDLVEISEDGKSVDKLSTGNYLGIILATNTDQLAYGAGEVASQTVCVLSEGRVELPVASEILVASALTPLKATPTGLGLAEAGDLSCAYLVHGEHNWSGTAVVHFFYPLQEVRIREASTRARREVNA